MKFDRKESKLAYDRAGVAASKIPTRTNEPAGRAAAADRANSSSRNHWTVRPSTIAPGDDPQRSSWPHWMTDPKNESFSGAMVNRIWQHFLGVGLVEPVDDLRATNPPTNPELWKALNQEFVEPTPYDMKHLMRVILNSRTYQLSSGTTPGNESDTRFLFALLCPPAAGRGAARRHQPMHWDTRSLPRLSLGYSRHSVAGSELAVLFPDAIWPIGTGDRLCLRAQRRSDDAAVAAPAKWRRLAEQDPHRRGDVVLANG